MARTFQIKRGAKSTMPTLAQGELGFTTDSNAEELYIGNGSENIQIARQDYVDEVIGAVEDSNTTYTLSKSDLTITLTGSDDSTTSVDETVTIATDDGAGNVVLESTAGISHMTESLKQELVDAVLASLTTETLTFVLADGSTVTREIVIME